VVAVHVQTANAFVTLGLLEKIAQSTLSAHVSTTVRDTVFASSLSASAILATWESTAVESDVSANHSAAFTTKHPTPATAN